MSLGRGHPSLPKPPHQHNQHASSSYTHNHGSQTANAVTSALINPYNQYYYPQSSHYAQAYANPQPNYSWPGTTPDGYTMSSTFNANPSTSFPQDGNRGGHVGGSQPTFRPPPSGGWYQPGDSRCTHNNCPFTGSKKSVEIHMMDRHLIYPPGWEKRKKQRDWDADPSLMGKTIPIQGTNILLDTPEALDAWIEERKKRWPSTSRVEDKKRKHEEAVARGQLDLDDFSGKKRRRTEDGGGYSGQRGGRGRGRGRGRGGDNARGRGRGRGGSARGGSGSNSIPMGPIPLPPKPQPMKPETDSSSGSDSESDGAPEAVSSKPPTALVEHRSSSSDGEGEDEATLVPEGQVDVAPPQQEASAEAAESAPASSLKPIRKVRPQQPKKPVHNPFGARPSLLRRLLLPEIRVTVSNLSQAIRFLVDNDFLENVELKPGEADEKMIEVIGESDFAAPDPDSQPPTANQPAEELDVPVTSSTAL
ncbi:hypothetical protein JAAARDRAFT_169692 [Jaapia argillacea MUCL 33604]|uniref:FMR1-interacting protein 1 conserved domain-containing protein n=1 Tax=Jaapia argillacea MUCL 33604 TaxID=933084 RepID=A0A067Q9K5_9AGAM|nr:hypothetical protein JAAARDRAFT_169692 [Jaapia argillacea MUCL 33604]